MAYTVKAPLVIAKNGEGSDVYVYQDGLVPDGQTDEWVKAHVDSGMIAEAELVADDEKPARGRRSAASDDE